MKYLDKMDAEENETPEPVKEDEEKDDPGSGEVAGSDRPFTTEKGHSSSVAAEGIVDVHRDEESDTDDEETENMRIGQSDRFWMVRVDELEEDDDGDGEEEEEEEKKENSSGKEIDEEGWEDDELVEAYEVIDRDDEDDVVEYDEGDDEEQGLVSASHTKQVTFTEGEIDGHDQGDDGADEDDNGETGEKDEHGVGEVGYEVKDWAEEDDDDEEENGSGYLVQPAIQPLDIADDNGDVSRDSDIKPVNDEENEEENGNDDLDVEEDVEDDMEHDHQVAQFRTAPSSSSHFKRKRCDEDDKDEDMADSDKEDDMFDE